MQRERSRSSTNWPRHLELTIAAAMQRRRAGAAPLGQAEAVPGCDCPTCVTYGVGGGPADAREAEEVVLFLAQMNPGDRLEAAAGWARDREAFGRKLRLPSAHQLVMIAAAAPGALRDLPSGEGRDCAPPHLDLEAARAVSIVRVAERLGLGTPQRRGREYVIRCPFHADRRPSLRISPKKGCWYCDPCGLGGDAIGLVQLVDRCEFRPAVDFVLALER